MVDGLIDLAKKIVSAIPAMFLIAVSGALLWYHKLDHLPVLVYIHELTGVTIEYAVPIGLLLLAIFLLLKNWYYQKFVLERKNGMLGDLRRLLHQDDKENPSSGLDKNGHPPKRRK